VKEASKVVLDLLRGSTQATILIEKGSRLREDELNTATTRKDEPEGAPELLGDVGCRFDATWLEKRKKRQGRD
jgi:hypothetical protein